MIPTRHDTSLAQRTDQENTSYTSLDLSELMETAAFGRKRIF